MRTFRIRPVFFLLGVSLTLNAALGAAAYRHYGGSRSDVASPQQPLVPGTPAPVLEARSLNGDAVLLTTGERPTVLYVLSPACGWCARNTANIEELWRQRSPEYRFIGLSIKADGLRAYLAENPLPFDVYIADPEMLDRYVLGITPSTMVIADGRIVRKWNGAFSRAHQGIKDFFGIELPGLQGQSLE